MDQGSFKLERHSAGRRPAVGRRAAIERLEGHMFACRGIEEVRVQDWSLLQLS